MDTNSAEGRDRVTGWFAGRLPDNWFTAAPEVTIDRDEILVVGALAAVALEGEATDAAREAAQDARVSRFRETTREARMAIADEAERAFGRKVAWGVKVGDERRLFTTLSIPVMTRLRQPERQVLDTLVEAGVARSRSDALAWCVRLVSKHQSEWIDGLREALVNVDKRRSEGPRVN